MKQLANYIDLEKLSAQGYQWQGEFSLNQFPRLSEVLNQQDTENTKNTEFSCEINKKSGIYWLEFSVKAPLENQCQRCLQAMDFILDEQIKLALLEDKAQASLLQEDDWLLLDDVVEMVKHERRLPILTMIEDELLLALPLVPKHDYNDENCLPVEILADEEEEPMVEEKNNPFAILAELKEK
ncbi:MAG: DUF177 domain-containing protein [Moraxellaceae bacterium]|nr:DUF177 domain-containing protein [Moraxellaceae bacterium]